MPLYPMHLQVHYQFLLSLGAKEIRVFKLTNKQMRTLIAFNYKQFIRQFIKGTAVMHCMPMFIIPIFHISSISSFELSPKSASWDKMVDKTGFIFQSLVNFYHHGKET